MSNENRALINLDAEALQVLRRNLFKCGGLILVEEDDFVGVV